MKTLRYIAVILLGLGIVVALGIAGFWGGLSIGLQYTDFPIIEAYGGLTCGGLVGIFIAIFLARKIWPHKKEKNSSSSITETRPADKPHSP